MFKPTQDFILVKPVKRRQSFTLEVISNEKYSRGLVIAVGPGERIMRNGEETGAIRPMQVKPGDFVTLENAGRYPLYVEDGVEYRVHQDKDVAFISERAFIDQHNELTDEQIELLLAKHREPMEIAA